MKDGISADTLEGVDVLVMGAPQQKFTVDEFDALKDFIHAGGSLFVLMDEGGEDALGTNINYLLEEYGIMVNGDAAVRVMPSLEYVHPKETLVTDGILNRALQHFVERGASRREKGSGSGVGRENEAPVGLESDTKKTTLVDDNESPAERITSSGGDRARKNLSNITASAPRFVTPFCATLTVQKPAAPVLSTGKAAYPMQRPTAAMWCGNPKKGEGRGKVAVLGSGRMADDEWLDREDNAKVLDFFLRWLSPGSDLRLYELDAEEPDVGEYEHVPDIAALAERPKACLKDGSSGSADFPKDFSQLFVDQMYATDTDLVPECVDLYGQLGVKKAPLDLIAPHFETPTPALRPAVFPPALRELPPPPLDLFDLEEEFAGEKSKLSALFHRCSGGTDEDLKKFIREGARICGVAPEEGEPDATSADAMLSNLFRRMVQFRMRDDFET